MGEQQHIVVFQPVPLHQGGVRRLCALWPCRVSVLDVEDGRNGARQAVGRRSGRQGKGDVAGMTVGREGSGQQRR